MELKPLLSFLFLKLCKNCLEIASSIAPGQELFASAYQTKKPLTKAYGGGGGDGRGRSKLITGLEANIDITREFSIPVYLHRVHLEIRLTTSKILHA